MESEAVFLILEPAVDLVFVGPFTRQVHNYLKITNPSKDSEVLYKIKTTAPKLYCVRPNGGKLGPAESIKIEICLQPFDFESDAKRHKFLIQAVQSPQIVENVNEFWKQVNLKDVWDAKIRCVLTLDCNEDSLNQSEGDGITKPKILAKGTESDDIKRDGPLGECKNSHEESVIQSLDTDFESAVDAELKELRHQVSILEAERAALKQQIQRERELADKKIVNTKTRFESDVRAYYVIAALAIIVGVVCFFVGQNMI